MMNFENMLKTNNSCAQETLAKAMVEWWMATDHEDAIQQINAAGGADLAGIQNSVISGLSALAEALGVQADELIYEENLAVLERVTPEQIVNALNAIHVQWVRDNFTAKRWGEKFFKGQLSQYRKTAKIAWSEAVKDLLFISEYLKKGGNTYSEEEIKVAFEAYAEANSKDDDLVAIAILAHTFAGDIVDSIKAYRGKLDPKKKAAQVEEIDRFLAEHSDGAEIMSIMIEAVGV